MAFLANGFDGPRFGGDAPIKPQAAPPTGSHVRQKKPAVKRT
jgi:hypothetical protein